MKNILWCPQHQITEDQRAELCCRLGEISLLSKTLPKFYSTLQDCPADRVKLKKLGEDLANYAADFAAVVMPIGSPALQFEFARAVSSKVTVIFAHSERVSKDMPQADGSVKKVSNFKHIKFI